MGFVIWKLLAQNVNNIMQEFRGTDAFEKQHRLIEAANALDTILMSVDRVLCSKRLSVLHPAWPLGKGSRIDVMRNESSEMGEPHEFLFANRTGTKFCDLLFVF